MRYILEVKSDSEESVDLCTLRSNAVQDSSLTIGVKVKDHQTSIHMTDEESGGGLFMQMMVRRNKDMLVTLLCCIVWEVGGCDG